VTTVVDRTGSVLVEMGTDERGTWLATVPLDVRTTPYVRFGDWVPAASIVVLALAAIGCTLSAPSGDRRRPGVPSTRVVRPFAVRIPPPDSGREE
jgi:hypothetical protein